MGRSARSVANAASRTDHGFSQKSKFDSSMSSTRSVCPIVTSRASPSWVLSRRHPRAVVMPAPTPDSGFRARFGPGGSGTERDAAAAGGAGEARPDEVTEDLGVGGL